MKTLFTTTAAKSTVLGRRGSGREVVDCDGDSVSPHQPDRSLIRAVARATRWREMLEAGEAVSPHDLARHEGFRVGYVNRLLPPRFLAPKVVEATLRGAAPRGVDLALPRVGLLFG